MPKLATPLTDLQPRTAKPKAKLYKLTDGGVLYLLINPDCAKYGCMGYRVAGAERHLASTRKSVWQKRVTSGLQRESCSTMT